MQAETEKMKDRFALSANDKSKLKTLACRYGIELAIVFGSRARGEARKDSDLDVGVLFKRMPSPRALYALGAAFSDLFKGDVDLVPLNFVNPELRRAAEREGKVLYERKPGIFAGFAVENLHRLHQRNYLRQYDRDFLDRFLRGRPHDENLHHHRRAPNPRQHRRRVDTSQGS